MGLWDRHPEFQIWDDRAKSEMNDFEQSAKEGESPVIEVFGHRDGTRVPQDT